APHHHIPTFPTRRSSDLKVAKWVNPHLSARDLAIEIQVADVEFLARAFQTQAIVAVDAAGQPVHRAIGNFERMVEIACPNQRQYGAKDFLLRQTRIWRDFAKYRRLDEIAVFRVRTTAADQ